MSVTILTVILCVIYSRLLENSAENIEELKHSENNGSDLEGFLYTTLAVSNFKERNASRSSEFPPDIFTKDQLRHGAVIFYLIGAMYSFGIIGIVCGDYFLPSVDCICTDLNLSQDIAAATFMSFATTAPELFIILIATYITKSDIGLGTVVGGGMFNILGVATIGGLAARTPIKLDWWPLYRDSLVYMFAPIGLAVVVSDGFVTWAEAVCLIAYYAFYFIIMFFNRRIRNWIKGLIAQLNMKKTKKDLSSVAIPSDKAPPIVPTISLTLDQPKNNEEKTNLSQEIIKEDAEENDDMSFKAYFMNYDDSISLRRISASSYASSRSTRSRKKSDRSVNARKSSVQIITSNSNQSKLGENLHFVALKLPDSLDKKKIEDVNVLDGEVEIPPEEHKDSFHVSFFTLPEGSLWNKITWMILWPSSFMLYYTIPDCRSKRWRNYYPVTFLMCVFWIAVASYFGTWMISVVGETIGISQSVMGLTFLALGGSMPEAISTFIMSRQGEGGLGFSNSLGGNTMDICLCLGLPWLLKAATNGPIQIESEGLQYNSIALVIGIIVLLSITTYTKFHMNKKMGFVCCVFYFIFIILSVLIEMNVIEVNSDS